MPMLRTLARAASAAATVIPICSLEFGSVVLPAVVSEGPVGLRHLVRVLAPLHRGAETVACVHQLIQEPVDHRLLPPRPRVAGEPAKAERGGPEWLDLHGHLVGRATDPAAAHLQRGLHVVHGSLERDDGVGAGLLAAALERAIDDALGQRTL